MSGRWNSAGSGTASLVGHALAAPGQVCHACSLLGSARVLALMCLGYSENKSKENIRRRLEPAQLTVQYMPLTTVVVALANAGQTTCAHTSGAAAQQPRGSGRPCPLSRAATRIVVNSPIHYPDVN